jgi:hypothetical protein
MALGTRKIEKSLVGGVAVYLQENGGLYTALPAHFTGNVTIDGTLTSGAEVIGAEVITSTSANAFAVGPAGTTNPSFNVNSSASSAATGLSVVSAAAASGLALSVTSSGSAENMTIDAKGTGTITLAGVSTGVVQIKSRLTIQSSNGNALAVGLNGLTNPVFRVDASVSSVATGVSITGAAAAGGVAVQVLSSGTDENITISAKGAGTVTFNSGVVAAAGGKVSSGIRYGSIAVGLYTGTGAPTFSAMNGSIYTDSDATSTTTRIYVNKSGAGTAGTTWTSLTTAA